MLQTGAEINEINNTGFCCNQTTIHVGNIGRYIVQVLSRSMRLLQGTRLLQNIQIDSDSPIVQVSICDPYVCAQTQSGAVITWALRDSKGMSRLAMNKNAISSVCRLLFCLYLLKRVESNNSILTILVTGGHWTVCLQRCIRFIYNQSGRLFGSKFKY